jgi:prophage maintenance system killer protein
MVEPMPQTEAQSFATRHSGAPSSAAYSSVTSRIARDHEQIRLSNQWLCEVQREVVGRNVREAGEWKRRANFFAISRGDEIWYSSYRTTGPELVPGYMEELERRFAAAWSEGKIHPLLLTATYWFEVVAIHPFSDANGRVSRLAALLLLWQSGHRVMKHASLEGAVARRRQAYLEALHASLRGWEDPRHDLVPWCGFVIEVVGSLYSETERRVRAAVSLVKMAEAVLGSIEDMPDVFLRRELMAILPAEADDLVGVILNRLRESGRLRVVREASDVRWEKIGQFDAAD